MDDCVCNAGFFRTDNTGALALALAQDIVALEHASTLWCVSCPIGFLCSLTLPAANESHAVAHVDKCTEMTTTLQPGSSDPSQCVCTPGAYAHRESNSTTCVACEKDFYCAGGAAVKLACPTHTVSTSKAVSMRNCICLPPFIILPTTGVTFANDCVLQTMAAYTDNSLVQTMQHNHYDIFTVQATMLHDTYATLPSTPCLSIVTGEKKCHSCVCGRFYVCRAATETWGMPVFLHLKACGVAGFVQACVHDIRVGTTMRSDHAIVLFRNILLDPVYLDMVLHLLSSARYNSVSYRIESYLWIQDTLPESDLRTLPSVIVSLAPLHTGISRQIRASYKCSLVLKSSVSALSPAHKTDLYNISKLRSFTYTSLQTLLLDNIDIVARPRHFAVFLHNSGLNTTTMSVRARQSIDGCLTRRGTAETTLLDHQPSLRTVRTYIEHAKNGASATMVTEIVIEKALCPSVAELQCLSTFVGALAAQKEVQCFADIDVLFTSLDLAQVPSTFQHYVEQIRGFDREILLEQAQQCARVVYIQHRASAELYGDIVDREKRLSQLHAAYRAEFADAVLFDSGIHALGVYNVTMKIGVAGQQIVADGSKMLQQEHEQKLHMQRVLQLLGVVVAAENVRVPNAMGLRQHIRDETSEGVDVIFSLVGTVLSASDVMRLVNTTIWLSTGQFASAGSVQIVQLASTISGKLFFGALSVSDARRLCVHIAAHSEHYTSAREPVFTSITSQRFVIPGHLVQEGVAAQASMRSHASLQSSHYTLRVSVVIPVEASMLNALLLEVLKTVIFQKTSVETVRLVSISRYATHFVESPASNAPEYTRVVYEMPVHSVELCSVNSNVNSEDYYLELSTVVSSLFGVDVTVQLSGTCLVTNMLQHAVTNSTMPLCESVRSHSMIRIPASHLVFFNRSSVAYSETCLLQTHVSVMASLSAGNATAFGIDDVLGLETVLRYGNAQRLTVAMQATLQLFDSTVDSRDLVRVFSRLYTPALQESRSNSSAHTTGVLSVFNDGMSASEKMACRNASHRVMVPIACAHNLSVAFSHNASSSCLQFVGLNNRIDLTMLRRFILSKTTPSMVQSGGIRISSRLHGFVQGIACDDGVNSLVKTLLLPYTLQAHVEIKASHSVQTVLIVQHVTPFVHIADYRAIVLRVVSGGVVQPTQFRMSTSAVLHLYTQGISRDTASAFFGIMMREYIVSRLEHATNIQLQIATIQPILQYAQVFPGSLFDNKQSTVQLYIQVRISGMRECAEIQGILDERVIHKTIYGIEMKVTIVDGVETRVTCNNTVVLDLTTASTDGVEGSVTAPCEHGMPSHEMTGKMVAGGTVLYSNTTCVQGQGGQCSAHLFSQNEGLFYALLAIITSQIDPLSFHFEHEVDFCGLDVTLLRPLITPQTLDFFGM